MNSERSSHTKTASERPLTIHLRTRPRSSRPPARPDAGTSEREKAPVPAHRPDSDAELVAACLQGSHAAWDALVRRYRRLVYSVPSRLGLKGSDADDIFQETFIALFQKLDGLRNRERLGVWLAVTARRRSLNRLTRGAAVHEVGFPEHFEPAGSHAHPIEALTCLEEQDTLLRALEGLPARCQELLRALYYDDPTPSYQALGRRLGMPTGSVGPTRLRCLDKLRERYRQLHTD
jgi:RNA polymerase sigma factor (sigma-70 family)